jgi:hypothetical protein
MEEVNIKGIERKALKNSSIIGGNTSGNVLVTWLGGSFLLKEMSLISGQLWWPVFSAGIGVLLVLRGITIYKNTKYWSNDKGAFISGAFFILLSLLSFVNFGALTNWWPVIIVVLGISLVIRKK